MTKGTFSTRRLVLMALFVAMSAALSPFVIMLTPTQKLFSFTLIPIAVGSVMLGPEAALLMGLASDTVNYLVNPNTGAYFPGYAISLAVSCLLYALWQYNRPLKLWRLACAQLCNIVIVYFGLNLLWATIFLGKAAASVLTVMKLLINLGQFPIVVGLVFALVKAAAAIEKSIQERKGER